MDLNDLTRDIEKAVSAGGRPPERKPDFRVKGGKLKAYALKLLAFALLAVVAVFGFIVIAHYRSPLMALVVLVYLALGVYLAMRLFRLTYTGWLYTLLLSAAGVLMPILALVTRGFSNAAFAGGALGVIAISALSAGLLWWSKDLFGIRGYRDIFVPYK